MTIIRPILDRMLHGDFERARDEVSRLAELPLLAEIQAILESSQHDAEKMYCYWMLGYLGRNTQSPLVADYLMERVAREQKAKLKDQVLQRLSLLSGAKNAENAIAALQDKHRDVRRHAIDALGSTTDPRGELALLELVGDADAATVRQATLALWRVATLRAIDPLAALFGRLPRNRMHEVTVAAALLTLSRLGPERALQLACRKRGASRAAFVNWASMLVIEQHGSAAQIDLVAGRLASLLKSQRKDMEYVLTLIDTKHRTELAAGVSFLGRFTERRALEILAKVRSQPASP